MIFPWQQAAWQQLRQANSNQRLAHGLLLLGQPGIGKTQFTQTFVKSLLCYAVQTTTHFPCETCHACRLISTNVHPNVLWVEPEKPGAAIKVDQIRAAIEFVQQSSLQGEYRFLIINPANNMNLNAANALLKTLEEPEKGAMLILISAQHHHLPATILSRCQRIHFPTPPKALALAFIEKALAEKNLSANPNLLLQLAHGAPLAALTFVDAEELALREILFQQFYELIQLKTDPLQAANRVKELDLSTFLAMNLSLLLDVVRWHTLGTAQGLVNEDQAPLLEKIVTKTTQSASFNFLRYVQQENHYLKRGINLNKQLVMEKIFIRWMECATSCS